MIRIKLSSFFFGWLFGLQEKFYSKQQRATQHNPISKHRRQTGCIKQMKQARKLTRKRPFGKGSLLNTPTRRPPPPKRKKEKKRKYIYIYIYHKGIQDTALEVEAQLYSDNRKIMQVKGCRKMKSYKTGQVGGRASQVGGITFIFRVKKRIIEPSVMAVIRPKWR